MEAILYLILIIVIAMLGYVLIKVKKQQRIKQLIHKIHIYETAFVETGRGYEYVEELKFKLDKLTNN